MFAQNKIHAFGRSGAQFDGLFLIVMQQKEQLTHPQYLVLQTVQLENGK